MTDDEQGEYEDTIIRLTADNAELKAAWQRQETHDKDRIERLTAELARWKAAIEGLTPQGSEYVDDPERCAEAIRERCRYPKQVIGLRAENAALREQIDGLKFYWMRAHSCAKDKHGMGGPYWQTPTNLRELLDRAFYSAAIDKAKEQS